MKTILITDAGGRGAALVDKYGQSPEVERILVVPGNDLMQINTKKKVVTFPNLKTTSISEILDICKKEDVDLVDVAQDNAVEVGVANEVSNIGISVMGPTKLAGRIEWDKAWARELMSKYNIPSPEYHVFNSQDEAIEFVKDPNKKWFVKASGLAEGKGALPAEKMEEVINAIKEMAKFGKSGETFLLEEWLVGEEFSAFAVCDGSTFKVVGFAQDHKRVNDGDLGPNTGGMGCVSNPLVVDEKIKKQVEEIFEKTVDGMKKEGRQYSGVLYLGGMVVEGKVYVIEFNARWGDPEAEVILPSIKNDYMEIVDAVISGNLKNIKIEVDNKVRVVVAACAKGYPTDYSAVKGKKILGIDDAIKSGVKIYAAGVKKVREDLPAGRQGFVVNGGRVLYLVGEGKDILEAREKVYNAMKKISIEGDNLHYRTDIGWRDVERMRNPERAISESNERKVEEMIYKIRVADKNSKKEVIKVYRLEGISLADTKLLSEKLLSESITQIYSINKPLTHEKVIEVAYKPGVMNPEVSSLYKAAEDLGIKLKAADSSHEYIVSSVPTFNPLTEYIVEKEPKTLIIKAAPGKTKIIPIRKMGDEKLLELSKDKLFLSLEEMKITQNYFAKIKRDPTDLELETLAQTWSEHCAHKTFKAKLIVNGKMKEPLFTRLKKEALKHKKNIVSAFVDNAGVMDFYDGWAINGKAETHNAPSAIEPYGGAMTGSGGVFRDVVATGQGAKPVVSTDIFCLAPPDMDKTKLPKGTLPPDYILKRVVSAVRDYGNRIGIPTNNGSFHFHDDFRAKPIVLVGAYGILPKSKAQIGRPKIGDIAVVIGGRTGRDGIHGATFSSGEMTERTMTVNATAVQIGNAIEEKRVFDAILEARDKDLIRAVQDLGAGGFSSAIGEMGAETGVAVHLEKAPLKYQGLSPWEIWVSESQERMLIVLSKRNLKKFLEISKKYNAEATEIAEFDGSRKLKVYFGKEKIGDLKMSFLHGGLPQRVMVAKKPVIPAKARLPDGQAGIYTNNYLNGSRIKSGMTQKEWISLLEKVLSDGNINSKEPILRMYDHNVQGTNALHPFTGEGMDGPNDASVIRPILDKPYGLIVSHGLNPDLTMKDPYWGTIWSATEAISNYVAVGGDYKNASLINNYIWPNPDEEWLGKLDQCVDAVCDFMKALKIPVISGKDSLSATYRGSNGVVIHSPPTLVMSVFGKISDVKKTVSSDFKKIGSTIVLVGQLAHLPGGAKQSPRVHLGGVPMVDLKLLPKVLEKIHKAIISGKVLSCHDISEGGLITAIFEMCVGGNCGAEISTSEVRTRLHRNHTSEVDQMLFNETAGCFVVEMEDESIAKKLFNGIPFKILGKTIKEERLMVDNLFIVNMTQLQEAWQKPMKEIFE